LPTRRSPRRRRTSGGEARCRLSAPHLNRTASTRSRVQRSHVVEPVQPKGISLKTGNIAGNFRVLRPVSALCARFWRPFALQFQHAADDSLLLQDREFCFPGQGICSVGTGNCAFISICFLRRTLPRTLCRTPLSNSSNPLSNFSLENCISLFIPQNCESGECRVAFRCAIGRTFDWRSASCAAAATLQIKIVAVATNGVGIIPIIA